jgi:hypothetical protein
VENPGNAPGMACLQGGPGPLSVPRSVFKRVSRRWATARNSAPTREQNRRAPLPTRRAQRRRFCPPYEAVPDIGARGRFRAHLSAASTQRFHQISFPGELERPEGIDPSSQRWHRYALPLSYGRIGGCGTDSNLHSTEAPGYSRPGFPIPYTPESQTGCRSASRTRHRTAYETARATGPTCNGGELRCRSPHRLVRIVFETSSAAGPNSSPAFGCRGATRTPDRWLRTPVL